MTAEEARECVDAIKGNLESLRLMLLELYQRRGWEALQYASFEECAKAEFGQSRSYAFQLVAEAEVKENLALYREKSAIVDLDLESIPGSHLSKLAKLPPEKQAEGLLRAEEIAKAKGKKRTAAHVAQAVKEIKQPSTNNADSTKEQSETEPASQDANEDTTESSPLYETDLNENVQFLHGQVTSAWQAIAQRPSEALALNTKAETELKQLFEEAKQIVEAVQRELERRLQLDE